MSVYPLKFSNQDAARQVADELNATSEGAELVSYFNSGKGVRRFEAQPIDIQRFREVMSMGAT